MASFKLTEEQELEEQNEFFKVVLQYVSNERKSTFIQLLDSDISRSLTDLVEEFERIYPDANSSYLSKKNMLSISNKVLSPLNLNLATEEYVPGRVGDEQVKAWRLTEKGKRVKRYASFILERMAKEFDQSIYPVLRTMNSTSDKVRPYEAVRLLYTVNEGPVSVEDLIVNTSPAYRCSLGDILSDLSNFKDSKGKPIPLVEIKVPTFERGRKGYQWVKGAPEYSITSSTTPRISKLLTALSSDPERIWSRQELDDECGDDGGTGLMDTLWRLESAGYIRSGYSREFKTANITSHGRRILYSLFDVIRGDIAGDEVSKGIIDRNQATPASTVKVLRHYVKIKNFEMGRSPSVSPGYRHA